MGNQGPKSRVIYSITSHRALTPVPGAGGKMVPGNFQERGLSTEERREVRKSAGSVQEEVLSIY